MRKVEIQVPSQIAVSKQLVPKKRGSSTDFLLGAMGDYQAAPQYSFSGRRPSILGNLTQQVNGFAQGNLGAQSFGAKVQAHQ